MNDTGKRRTATTLKLTALAALAVGLVVYTVAVLAEAHRGVGHDAYVRLMIAVFVPPPALAAISWAAGLTLRNARVPRTRHDRHRRPPLIDASDIACWIDSLPAGARVGIDDDTLVAYDRHDRPLGAHTTLEVGDRPYPEDID